MSSEFKGLSAAVTGAGSGIGLATLKMLADAGATVYGLDIAEGGIAEHGTWLQCDVGDDASVKAAFSKIAKLDILINSAAISSVGTVEANPSEEWHKVMNVNVVGIVRTVREADLARAARRRPAGGPGPRGRSVRPHDPGELSYLLQTVTVFPTATQDRFRTQPLDRPLTYCSN